MGGHAAVAAIRGACPAGGCCLALTCDYRIQSQQGTFGLNETALGVPVPPFWAMLMTRIIGQACRCSLRLACRL